MAHTKKAVPGHGEGGGDSRRKGQVGADTDCIKKAAPVCPVWASCCRAVTVFHHRRTKKLFLSVPQGGGKEKFFICLFCFLLSGKVLFHSF